MTLMTAPERFLAACACRPVDRTPVWMMRQAGRYLPEYRAVREKVDFLTLCRTPELAAQVALQPIDRFGVDACIVFSDILVLLAAMGAPVTYSEDGPRVEVHVGGIADVDKLQVPDPQQALSYVLDTVRQTKAALAGRAALVGFVGGPFTLASYLVRDADSKGVAAVKTMLYEQPSTLHALLAKLADAAAELAAAQVDAGAQAIQVFDTWAGELEPQAYADFALPYQAAVIQRIRRSTAPAILYVNGCAGVLEHMAASGADVLSVDWRVSLADVRARIGTSRPLQGNVDPHILTTTESAVERAARAAMDGAGSTGHILNLGHGVLPSTKLSCAQAFVETAKARATSAL